MSKPPPKPARHLYVFAVSLVVIVGVLAVFLFGVTMEDAAPGKGVITSGRLREVRAPVGGRFELGPDSADACRLEAGAGVDGSCAFGTVTTDGPNERVVQIPPPGAAGTRWRVLEAPATSGQRVTSGDLIARLVEIDPQTERPLEPLIRLDIEERYFGEVAPGQEVRLYSNMYHHRTYGVATGRVERLEPAGEAGPNGQRVFRAWVAVTESPFPLKLGSSMRAEVLVGRKPTYRIILEH